MGRLPQPCQTDEHATSDATDAIKQATFAENVPPCAAPDAKYSDTTSETVLEEYTPDAETSTSSSTTKATPAKNASNIHVTINRAGVSILTGG